MSIFLVKPSEKIEHTKYYGKLCVKIWKHNSFK